jgi:hypothetical protein
VINPIPQCAKCGSSVTDSIESEIEQHGKIKIGSHINGKWICDDCLAAEKKKEEYSLSHTSRNDNSNDNECDNIGWRKQQYSNILLRIPFLEQVRS